MKTDIISQKISRELSNLPIDTEARVMYLLVEIRKVLEHDDKLNSILGFYGNWVVHTRLDRKFAHQIFDEINDDNSQVGNHLRSFNLLRNELKDFFVYNDLATDLVDEHWEPFRDKLLDILIDTPVMNDKGDKSFGFHKTDDIGGIQYYIKHDSKFHSLGRVWV